MPHSTTLPRSSTARCEFRQVRSAAVLCRYRSVSRVNSIWATRPYVVSYRVVDWWRASYDSTMNIEGTYKVQIEQTVRKLGESDNETIERMLSWVGLRPSDIPPDPQREAKIQKL